MEFYIIATMLGFLVLPVTLQTDAPCMQSVLHAVILLRHGTLNLWSRGLRLHPFHRSI